MSHILSYEFHEMEVSKFHKQRMPRTCLQYILQVNFSGFLACRAELINLGICQLNVKAMEIEEGYQVILCISNFIKF